MSRLDWAKASQNKTDRRAFLSVSLCSGTCGRVSDTAPMVRSLHGGDSVLLCLSRGFSLLFPYLPTAIPCPGLPAGQDAGAQICKARARGDQAEQDTFGNRPQVLTQHFLF